MCLETDVEICAKVFRHYAMIENLLPMLTHSNVNVAFYIAKALAAVCAKSISSFFSIFVIKFEKCE
jgi:hypothetical protein